MFYHRKHICFVTLFLSPSWTQYGVSGIATCLDAIDHRHGRAWEKQSPMSVWWLCGHYQICKYWGSLPKHYFRRAVHGRIDQVWSDADVKIQRDLKAKLAKLRAQSTANFPALFFVWCTSRSRCTNFVQHIGTRTKRELSRRRCWLVQTASSAATPAKPFNCNPAALSIALLTWAIDGFQALVQFEAETEGGFHIS